MVTDRILFLATTKAYELINFPEPSEGVKFVLEEAFKLYENAKRGVKTHDGTGLDSAGLPLSIYARWAKLPNEEDLILILENKGLSFMLNVTWKGWNGPDRLSEALETAIPILAH